MPVRRRCTAIFGFLVLFAALEARAQGPESDSDLRFLDDMIVHHQAAIDEARAIQPTARRPEVRELAADIVATQQAEIDQMRAWRRAWYPNAPATPSAGGMPMSGGAAGQAPHGGGAMAMPGGTTAGEDPDLVFVEMMIPHHRDAVAMSRQILTTTKRPEVRRLAEAIIEAQEKEMALMAGWKKAWEPAAK